MSEGGKEEASVDVRFFFVVKKKLCADRLHKMKSCQKFQVAEASGFVTAFCEQCSDLPQLFSRFLVPTLFSLALGQLCSVFLGAPPGSRMQRAIPHYLLKHSADAPGQSKHSHPSTAEAGPEESQGKEAAGCRPPHLWHSVSKVLPRRNLLT